MKKFPLSILFVFILFNAVSQRVDLDRLRFVVKYTYPPERVIAPTVNTYTVFVKNSSSVAEYVPTLQLLKEINVVGHQKVEKSMAQFSIYVEMDEFFINRNEIKSTTTESNGKKVTTYKHEMEATLGAKYWVIDSLGKYLIDPTRVGSNSFINTSSDFSTYADALNYRRDKSGSIRISMIRNRVDYLTRTLGNIVTNLYGYGIYQEHEILWQLDSKKHPEFENYTQNTRAIVSILEKQTGSKQPENYKEEIRPIVEYFEKLSNLDNEEKANQKLVYGASFNLAVLSYWLDRPKLTKKFGEKIISNDYDTKDGEKFVNLASELEKSLAINGFENRQIDRSTVKGNVELGTENIIINSAEVQPKNTFSAEPVVKKATASILIFNDDTEKEGYIINYSNSDPWEIQKNVRFVPAELYNDGKYEKKSVIKYDPKDLKAFSYDNLIYFSVAYTDFDKGASALLGAKQVFARVLVDGKVKLLEYFTAPAALQVGNLGAMERERQELLKKGGEIIIIEGDDNKAKALTTSNVETILEKYESLNKKYMEGAYSKNGQPVNKKRSIIAKLSVKTEMDDNIDFRKIFEDINSLK